MAMHGVSRAVNILLEHGYTRDKLEKDFALSKYYDTVPNRRMEAAILIAAENALAKGEDDLFSASQKQIALLKKLFSEKSKTDLAMAKAIFPEELSRDPHALTKQQIGRVISYLTGRRLPAGKKEDKVLRRALSRLEAAESDGEVLSIKDKKKAQTLKKIAEAHGFNVVIEGGG